MLHNPHAPRLVFKTPLSRRVPQDPGRGTSKTVRVCVTYCPIVRPMRTEDSDWFRIEQRRAGDGVIARVYIISIIF